MDSLESFTQEIPAIERKLGYQFRKSHLLTLAFVHRSFVNENRALISQSNERLEFLGDSVLGLLVAEELYAQLPETMEGELSAFRARLVQASACASYIQRLGLGDYLLVGRGEQMTYGKGRETLLADLFEAIIGAIYLDGGLMAAKEFLFSNLRSEMEVRLEQPEQNWKALLQDYAQRQEGQMPLYEVKEESGPDHQKHFVVEVQIAGAPRGRGEGTSKKQAQQQAARDALKQLGLIDG